MANNIKFRQDAREALQKGVSTIADAVTTTLGPLGRNVAISKANNQGKIFERIVIHDGVNVSRAVILKDESENMGASIVREAALKTVQECGDGTTLTICMADAIISEASKLIASGVNPMTLRRGIESARDAVLENLDKMAIPIKQEEQAVQIATVSAQDKELGTMIGKTMYEVGLEGIVTVEETKSPITSIDHQEGMQIDRGYADIRFVNNPTTMEAILKDAHVLVTDYAIDSNPVLSDLVPLFEDFFKTTNKTICIIAKEISGDALLSLIANRVQGTGNILCVNAPGFNEVQTAMLEDIATLTGATFISESTGKMLSDVTKDDLGHARSITSNRDATIIVDGKGDEKDIEDRITAIRSQIKQSKNEFDIEKLKERLAKLTSGVIVIQVGGSTEVEMKERKERADDAYKAVHAAMREGIVAGGEVAYLRIQDNVKSEDYGEQLVYRALSAPFYKLLENAGLDAGEYRQTLKGKSENYGVDVTKGVVVDMVKEGIVDPIAVLKSAITNAVSVSVQVITTDVVITPDLSEKK